MLKEYDVISIDGGLSNLLLGELPPHIVAQATRRLSRKSRQVTTVTAIPHGDRVSLIQQTHTGRIGLPMIAVSEQFNTTNAFVCIRPGKVTLQVAENR